MRFGNKIQLQLHLFDRAVDVDVQIGIIHLIFIMEISAHVYVDVVIY